MANGTKNWLKDVFLGVLTEIGFIIGLFLLIGLISAIGKILYK